MVKLNNMNDNPVTFQPRPLLVAHQGIGRAAGHPVRRGPRAPHLARRPRPGDGRALDRPQPAQSSQRSSLRPGRGLVPARARHGQRVPRGGPGALRLRDALDLDVQRDRLGRPLPHGRARPHRRARRERQPAAVQRADYSFRVDENAPVHTEIGRVRTYDADMTGENNLTYYKITAPDELGVFGINEKSGNTRVPFVGNQ